MFYAFCIFSLVNLVHLLRGGSPLWAENDHISAMSANVKKFNLKVPTKVNTKAEFCDKKVNLFFIVQGRSGLLGNLLTMQILTINSKLNKRPKIKPIALVKSP